MPESAREIEYRVSENEAGLKVREIMSGKLKLSSREITRCKQFEDGVLIKCAGDSQYKMIWLRETVREGDILKVKIYEDTDNAGDVIPSDGPIDIVYEDEDLILLNKPGDMVVHPSYAHHQDSLSNVLGIVTKDVSEAIWGSIQDNIDDVQMLAKKVCIEYNNFKEFYCKILECLKSLLKKQ